MNTIDVLKYGHADALRAIEEIPQDKRETVGLPTTPAWSLKDVVSHLASYEQFLLDAVRSVTDSTNLGSAIRAMSDPKTRETFNDDEVAQRKEKTFEEVMAEFKQTHENVLSAIAALPPDALSKTGTIPWYGGDYSLEDFIVYANYGHIQGHVTGLHAYKEQLSN